MRSNLDVTSFWVLFSLMSCVIWLVMGSSANTIAYATRVVPNKRSGTDIRSALVKSIAVGVQFALDQCRMDFKWERWNCPEKDFSKRYVLPSTREMAYVSAITAAGITYAVARACAQGEMDLVQCRCNASDPIKTEEDVGEVEDGWSWRNCETDLQAGQKVSEVFMKSLEEGAEDIRAQANSHNFRLGRKAVELESAEDCKCHGISGSCTMRTCWGRVASFAKVGKLLKMRYTRAIRVTTNRNLGESLDPGIRKEMVYLEESPNFCKPNSTLGWPGTEGRACSRRKSKIQDITERRSCRELCRSCGYQVKRRPIKTMWRCNCTFHWCCDVTCHTCTKIEHERYCDANPSPLVSGWGDGDS